MLPVPNGKRTFIDPNGHPISGGSVYSYVPGTSNPSATYADEGMTVANPNPMVLDQAGRAVMWAPGLLRQVVYDMFGNLQWDQETGFSLDNYQGDFTLDGNLTVNGSSTFNGPTNINSSLNVAGPTNLDGGANIANGANVSGGLNTDNINNSGNINTNTLDANGITDNGNMTVGGSLTVTGPSDLNGGLTTSSINDTGDLHVGGNAQIDGNLNVSGSITGGGGGGTPTPQPTIIPVRVANVGNGSVDNISTSDGLVVYTFDPAVPGFSFTIQLPSGAPTGFTVVTKLGLLVYESQGPTGGSPGVSANWLPASGGTIDGLTFSPAVPGGPTLPYNFEGAGVGTPFSFTNGGGDNWYISVGG